MLKNNNKEIAEQVSALLGDDGSRFVADDGREFEQVMDDFGAIREWRDGYRTGDTIRYTFDDESVITECGGGWDVGYPDCFCWQSVGHSDECTKKCSK